MQNDLVKVRLYFGKHHPRSRAIVVFYNITHAATARTKNIVLQYNGLRISRTDFPARNGQL